MNKINIFLLTVITVLVSIWIIYSTGTPIVLPAKLPVFPTMPIAEGMCDDHRVFQPSKNITCLHTKTDSRKHRFYKVECDDFEGWIGVYDLRNAERMGESYTGYSIYNDMREEYCPWKNEFIKKG